MFHPLKCRFPLWNSSSKKPKIRHRCRHCEQYAAARLRFRDVIPSKRFCLNGFCEVNNRFEENILLTLWRIQSQLQVFLLAANFESDGMMSHKRGLAAKYNSKRRPPKSLHSRRISSGWQALQGLIFWLVGWLNVYYRRRQKRKTFWSDLLL